ncbi:MAG: YihY/virulence factor BrkB family protein [Microbacteriaceae bacterium]
MAKTPTEDPTLVARLFALVDRLVKWVEAQFPMRVLTQFGNQRGYLLSAGLSYQGVFATFAALWVTFSIAGLYVRTNPDLLDAIFAFLAMSVPGLIGVNGNDGAINPKDLLSASILGWTGAVALVGLFFTALGWLAGGRDAVRAMFRIGPLETNFFLVKVKDAGLAIAFGVALLISAAITVASTSALESIFTVFGIDEASPAAAITVRIVALALVFVFDAFVLALFYRTVSGIRIPPRRLLGGTLIGAGALGVLKTLGSTLLGGAAANPLLASFAAIIGILIWFNIVSQVILLGAAWIAVGMQDRGIPADPRAHDADMAAAAAREHKLREQIIEELSRPSDNWFTRNFGRKK